ncbi:MAG: FliM/FliN family flagellar motor switch protein [Gammaproteobacteria bacterium]|nr:FliM/FliN family flagellar motor switch protein [Gammaproteobacteria bacterium]
MSDVLSKDEVDALVNGVPGDEEDSRIVTIDDYELYDLTSGMHRAKGWAQEVKIVDERFRTNLSINLLALLHRSVEVKRKEILISKFDAYSKEISVPSSINVYALTGLIGFSGIVLDAKLVHALVNAFFGGGSRNSDIGDRDFTHTEQRVVKLILRTIIATIKASWRDLSTVEFMHVETEVNPLHLASFAETDVLMIRPFSVEFAGGGGEIQLIMPGSGIDAIFRHKKLNEIQENYSPRETMKSRALTFSADVTGELTGARLTIGEIFRLEEGDIISVDSPEQVDVKINGVTKFKATMGEIDGKAGLKILC